MKVYSKHLHKVVNLCGHGFYITYSCVPLLVLIFTLVNCAGLVTPPMTGQRFDSKSIFINPHVHMYAIYFTIELVHSKQLDSPSSKAGATSLSHTLDHYSQFETLNDFVIVISFSP